MISHTRAHDTVCIDIEKGSYDNCDHFLHIPQPYYLHITALKVPLSFSSGLCHIKHVYEWNIIKVYVYSN